MHNLGNVGSNMGNMEGMGSSANIVSEEFVTILNNLSNIIKNLMKNNKIYIGSAKISTDTVSILINYSLLLDFGKYHTM